MNLPWSPTRIGMAAGLAAGSLGLVLATGMGPAPALVAADSAGTDDAPTTSTTVAPGTGTTVPGDPTSAGAAVRTVDAAGAGTVAVSVAGTQLRLVSAVPSAGWTVEVEQDAGREVEVDFRMGSRRVQVDVEFEDGAVRDRVRVRDEATGAEAVAENGVLVGAEDGASGAGSSDDGAHDATDDRGGDRPAGVSDDRGADDNGGDLGGSGDDDGTADDDGTSDDPGHGRHGGDDRVDDDHGHDG